MGRPQEKGTSEWKRKLVRVFGVGLCAVDARGCDAPRVTADEVDVEVGIIGEG